MCISVVRLDNSATNLRLQVYFNRDNLRTMTLAKYIEKHGVSRCAAAWKVAPRTVNYWKAGKTKPQRNAVLTRVMKESGLSITDIYK